MKNRFLIFAATVFMASCEKVVNIDLSKSTEKYVIEAPLLAGSNKFHVTIAKTTDYYGQSPQQKVNDALVWISSADKPLQPVPFKGDGNYAIDTFNAIPGREYKLIVKAAGHEFLATTTVPLPVSIDSVSCSYQKDDIFSKKGFEVSVFYKDPEQGGNYYLLVYAVNDTLQTKPGDIYVFDDRFSNGIVAKQAIVRRFNAADNLIFDLRAMDENTYNYFNALNDIVSNQNGPSPSNPPSNINGGALGYFGGFNSNKKKVIVN